MAIGKFMPPGLDEGTEAFVFLEEDGGDEAHDRAHHGADAEGDGVGDEGRAVIRAHDLEGQDVGDATDHEELEDEGDRHLMESGEETEVALSDFENAFLRASLSESLKGLEELGIDADIDIDELMNKNLF